LVTSGYGLNDGPVVRHGWPARQRIDARQVIQPAVDACEHLRGNEPLERFVDGRARGEIEEVDGRPYVVRMSDHAVLDSASQVESWSAECGHLSVA
jgi:hypothetical protein